MLFIAFTFAFLLLFARKANQSANRFLAITVTIAGLWIGQTVAIDSKLFSYNSIWSLLQLQYSLTLGPLLYFYVQKVVYPKYNLKRQDLLHFVPLLLELSVYLLPTLQTVKAGAINYKSPVFQVLASGLHVLAFISVIVYLYRCGILIQNFYREIKFNGGDRYLYELRWLQNLLAGFGLIWLLWIPFTVADYCFYHHELSVQAYYPIYFLSMSALIYMAAKVFLRQEIEVKATAVLNLTPLLASDLKQKGIWLKRIVEENRYYQDPELNLSSLAEKAGISAHELSRILNQALKKTFNDFINAYRVRAAASKMHDPAFHHITLLGIAFESGFNSQSSFHRIFKQLTGKSPLEYKNHLEKVLPSYNMGGRNQLAPLILSHDTLPKWSDDKLNCNYMFENYFKTAWRNLKKNKVYSALNIVGLAIGIVSAALIFLWVEDELNSITISQNVITCIMLCKMKKVMRV